VKINPVVKYDWEQRRYIGNLIAVHLNRTHVAYVLRGMKNNITSFTLDCKLSTVCQYCRLRSYLCFFYLNKVIFAMLDVPFLPLQ